MDKETKVQFKKVDKRLTKMDAQFKKIDKRFEQVDKRFDKIDTTLEEHREAIETLQDSFELFKIEAATKTDIRELRSEMHEMKNEILSHIDGFVGHHKNQDTELTALRSGYNRHDEQIQHIAHHVGLRLT